MTEYPGAIPLGPPTGDSANHPDPPPGVTPGVAREKDPLRGHPQGIGPGDPAVSRRVWARRAGTLAGSPGRVGAGDSRRLRRATPPSPLSTYGCHAYPLRSAG